MGTRNPSVQQLLRGVQPDLRDLMYEAHEQKFRVTLTGSGHLKVTTPEHWREQRSVFSPRSSSDIRALHRVRSKLRGIGVVIPHR